MPRPNNKHQQESPVVTVTALFSGLFNYLVAILHIVTSTAFDLQVNIKIGFPDPQNIYLDTKIMSLSQLVEKLELVLCRYKKFGGHLGF